MSKDRKRYQVFIDKEIRWKRYQVFIDKEKEKEGKKIRLCVCVIFLSSLVGKNMKRITLMKMKYEKINTNENEI